MKKLLISILILIVCLQMIFVAGSGTWSRTYGGTGWDQAPSVVQTNDNGYAIVGFTNSFGAGDYDFWLVKIDSNGAVQWNKTYGGTGSDQAWSVIQTSDGGYAIIGFTNSFGAGSSDAWLVKIDSNGNHQWNQTYGGSDSESCREFIQTADGGYALAIWANTPSANRDIMLVKTDSSGNIQWTKMYGGINTDTATSIIQTSEGGYAILSVTDSFGEGNYDGWLIKTDSGGNHEWNKTYGAIHFDWFNDIRQTADGGYFLTARTQSFGVGITNAWFMKIDSSGNHQWNKTYGVAGLSVNPSSMDQTSDGGYIMGGTISTGGTDLWLIKIDSNGDKQWDKTYGALGYDTAYSVVQTSDSGYVTAGITSSFGSGSYDFWVVKTDGSGVLCFNVDNDGSYSCDSLGGVMVSCGSTSTCDCNDNDAGVKPGATEICDGKDNDCDGVVDEGYNVDGDGYKSCSGDCNDNDASVNPGATEICDGKDNDCDGSVDEGGVCGATCVDKDNDKYGISGTCQKIGYDCDDNNRFVNLGMAELCTTPYDDNCNGQINEGCDSDGDGSPSTVDCNDANPNIYPGAVEVCNNQDDDCDGLIDEGLGCTDLDGDGIVNGDDICPADFYNLCNENATQQIVNSTSSVVISPENGDISLDIGVGDVPDNTLITITKNDSLSGSSFSLSTRAGSEAKTVLSYKFEPEGIQLNNDVVITMYWDDIDNDGREDVTSLIESKFDIYWYNPGLGVWEDQNAVCDVVNNYCMLQINHFSDYALGEEGPLQQEEEGIPEVGRIINGDGSFKDAQIVTIIAILVLVAVLMIKKK